ncbi:MAG: SAM-dependent methyltransferase, partial [Planctomycetota bacterium]
WLGRSRWPVGFASDNVVPSPDHRPSLRHKFETVGLDEQMTRLPYVPLLRTPYYVFIGRKPVSS